MPFTWPSEPILPKPSVDLGGSVKPATVRTNMESGRPRQRKRFTTGWRTKNVSWVLTNDEFAIFQAIVKFKLNNGADFFDMALPIGDPDDETEAEFAVQSVRFVDGVYKYSYQDVMHWKVSATLETENTSPMDEATLDGILA